MPLGRPAGLSGSRSSILSVNPVRQKGGPGSKGRPFRDRSIALEAAGMAQQARVTHHSSNVSPSSDRRRSMRCAIAQCRSTSRGQVRSRASSDSETSSRWRSRRAGRISRCRHEPHAGLISGRSARIRFERVRSIAGRSPGCRSPGHEPERGKFVRCASGRRQFLQGGTRSRRSFRGFFEWRPILELRSAHSRPELAVSLPHGAR
jgi:hypothetical protein